MAEKSLYERLGGDFAIAAVVDHFSDQLLKNPKIVNATPELKKWHTEEYKTRLPGLKFLRTLWVCAVSGGPFQYTGEPLGAAHFRLHSHPKFSMRSLRSSPTPLTTSKCPRAKRRKSWPRLPHKSPR